MPYKGGGGDVYVHVCVCVWGGGGGGGVVGVEGMIDVQFLYLIGPGY